MPAPLAYTICSIDLARTGMSNTSLRYQQIMVSASLATSRFEQHKNKKNSVLAFAHV